MVQPYFLVKPGLFLYLILKILNKPKAIFQSYNLKQLRLFSDKKQILD